MGRLVQCPRAQQSINQLIGPVHQSTNKNHQQGDRGRSKGILRAGANGLLPVVAPIRPNDPSIMPTTTTPRRRRSSGEPPAGRSRRQKPSNRRYGLASIRINAGAVLKGLLLLLAFSGVIVGVAAAPEGAYDDDREGGSGGGSASSPTAAAGTTVLARRSHRLIGGGDGAAKHAAAAEGEPASMAVPGGGGGDGHESYAAARGARMPLDLFTRVLHTPAEGELAGEDGLLHDALDFQWRLLAASPAKPAPFLVCGAYGHGACVGLVRSIDRSNN